MGAVANNITMEALILHITEEAWWEESSGPAELWGQGEMERLVPGRCPVIHSQESLDEGHCLSREGCWEPGCEMRVFPGGS